MKRSSFSSCGMALLLGVGCLLALFSCQTSSSLMAYRTLAGTGVQVGEIALGCGGFGKLTPEESRLIMDTAMAYGMNYIDVYDANPVVRDNIGYAIKGRTHKIFIQGHIGNIWVDGQYKKTRDVEEAKAGFEDLLQRLGVKQIEVGMIHIVDAPEQWAEIEGTPFMDYVLQLKKEGVIKHIGVSSHNALGALAAAKSGVVDVIMFSTNPAFDRIAPHLSVWDPAAFSQMQVGMDPDRVAFFDYCTRNHISVISMKTFGGGDRLLSAQTSPLGVALTPTQCLGYVLSKPCVTAAVLSVRSMEALHEYLGYLTATEAERDYQTALNPSAVAYVGEGTCTYCTHCAPCPQMIDVAAVSKLLDRALVEGGVSAELLDQYQQLEHYPGECIACGACESRCPFGVPVVERMAQAAELFGK